MSGRYGLSLALAILFIGFLDTHTDELPIILGLIMMTAALVSAAFPRRAFITTAVTGSALFACESLVHFGFLHARYAPIASLPWPAFIALIPAAIGAAAGSLTRHHLAAHGS